MRKAAAALVVTVVAVVLLARYETEPPVTVNPNSALRGQATPRAIATRGRRPGRRRRRAPARRTARR